MTNAALPTTITLDYQPYGHMILGNLHWAVEADVDWNNGRRPIERKVLRGTVIEGRERGYLFGASSGRDITGQTRTVYGVREDEITRGHIVRIAG